MLCTTEGNSTQYWRMLLWILVSVCAIAAAQQRSFSYSGEYGGTGGKRFSQSGNQLDGEITALRIRSNRLYITGIQVRYGTTWSEYRGGRSGDLEEILLSPGEHISRVNGKYTSTVQRLVFITNKRRVFSFGKDIGTTFSGSPLFPDTFLRYISGRSSFAINAIGFHWDYPSSNCVQCNK
ncbi:zymogen granule membrane protein 16-like isoform X1 [Aquarana catesbeiana]|uniref:zymogen granule membrane protein 16-like isoform X1 n=2 Tax=Aquarana catesbeiana TaxID=8400 RepID=UPI003CCA3172